MTGLVPCANCKSPCEPKQETTFQDKAYCCTSERDQAESDYKKTLIKTETK